MFSHQHTSCMKHISPSFLPWHCQWNTRSAPIPSHSLTANKPTIYVHILTFFWVSRNIYSEVHLPISFCVDILVLVCPLHQLIHQIQCSHVSWWYTLAMVSSFSLGPLHLPVVSPHHWHLKHWPLGVSPIDVWVLFLSQTLKVWPLGSAVSVDEKGTFYLCCTTLCSQFNPYLLYLQWQRKYP